MRQKTFPSGNIRPMGRQGPAPDSPQPRPTTVGTMHK